MYKKNLFVILIIIAFFNVSFGEGPKFGIGLNLNQARLNSSGSVPSSGGVENQRRRNQLGYSYGSYGVSLPFYVTSNIRIEPKIGFYMDSGRETVRQNSTWNYSDRLYDFIVGATRFNQFEKTRVGIGGFLGVMRYYRKNNFWSDINSSRLLESTQWIYTLGPQFSGEYFFTSNISFGADLTGVFSYSGTPNVKSSRNGVQDENDDDISNWSVYPSMSMNLRFYL